MLEGEWEQDRIQLYQTWKAHPEWSKTKLARHLGRSVSWVYKWLKRLTPSNYPA